jgi:endonuclease/exonuclease/phosphatase family metal-dependent hydrolase
MKKLSFLLAIILLLSVFLMTACNKNEAPQETTPKDTAPDTTLPTATTPNETTAPDVEPPVVHASISLEQLAKYELIYAKDSSKEVKSDVKPLLDRIYNTFGIMLNQRTDLYYEGVESLAKGQYEILIGHTNREESETFLSALRWDDYGYGMVGDKLVIAGKNEDGTLKALRAFLEFVSRSEGRAVFFTNADQFLVQTNYPYPNLTINGISVSDLAILCNQEELGGVAQIIRDAIIKASGIAVPIVTDRDIERVENKLVIGRTNQIIIDDAPVDSAYPTGKEFYISKLAGGLFIDACSASGYWSAAAYIAEQLSGECGEKVVFEQKQYMGEDAIGVMSFNLKAESKTAEYNARTDAVVGTILKYRPAVVGVQEATDQWMNILREKLGDVYTIVGEGRNAEGHDEHSAILYLTEEFDCIESGTKWLSDTPDNKGSKFAESHYTRIMTYALLSRKSDGKQFLHVNTHLDYGTTEAEEQVKVKQMQVIFDEIAKLSSVPTIITGDFNATVDSPVYEMITAKEYQDSCPASLVPSPTYHGLMGNTGEPSHIDFIFSKGLETSHYYRICTERAGNENVSDHYPIFSILSFNQ